MTNRLIRHGSSVAQYIAELRAEANHLEMTILTQTPIADLNFSNRTQNALVRNDIRTVQALVSLTRMEVLRLPTLGGNSVKEIEQVLALNSLRLRVDPQLMIECAACGKPFVKDHHARIFCSKACILLGRPR